VTLRIIAVGISRMGGPVMKLKDGQYVRHSKYGWGTILECNRDHTMVYFYRVGVRKLTVSEAVFQAVEDQVAMKRREG
jgi:hypothetical protein